MDRRLYRWVNHLADRTSWAHGLFAAYANLGIVLFALLLLIVYLQGRRDDDPTEVAGALWAGGAALIALELAQIIGRSIDRLRPYESMTDVHVLVARSADFSIPSDHATVVGAVAMGLVLVNRRWGTIAAGLAVLMAFTRVYVGAHYPGDVVAGLALGAATAVAGHFVIAPLLRRLVLRLRGTRAARLVSTTPAVQVA
jgi:membrane-associated phospholipid phosphatase